jgi:uncharacterized protein (TIGR03067 family)
MRRYVLLVLAAGLLVAADKKEDAATKELKKLAGTWQADSYALNGQKAPPDDLKKIKLAMTADGKATVLSDGKAILKLTVKLDPTQQPKTIDLTFTEGDLKGKTALGIYELKGDTFRLCRAAPGKERPSEFSSKPKSGHALMTYKRVKAKSARE